MSGGGRLRPSARDFGLWTLVFGGCTFPPVSLGPAGDCPCTVEGLSEGSRTGDWHLPATNRSKSDFFSLFLFLGSTRLETAGRLVVNLWRGLLQYLEHRALPFAAPAGAARSPRRAALIHLWAGLQRQRNLPLLQWLEETGAPRSQNLLRRRSRGQ